MRDIYSGGVSYSAEGSCQLRNNIYGWASAGFFDKKGNSIGGGNSTYIKIVPLGIGIKYFYTIPYCYNDAENQNHICPKNLHLYLGGGYIASYVYIKNDYPQVIEKHAKWGSGLIIKSGLIIDLTQFLFIDLFMDYSYTHIDYNDDLSGKIKRYSADIGGLYLGAGLGARF